jgi:cytochrome c oxidase accessory protein FixG
MCPYARFQGAMFDRDTLIISYDRARGEPRGSRARNIDYQKQGLGDCIECTLCVQVCPTGIDIRNGLQVGCIACAACVDVCDSVMGKMGYPKGLIRYTTENELEAGQPRQILRPRVVIYALVLVGITMALIVAVLMRVPLELDVIRDRNTLYREAERGRIENVYTLKIMNMDNLPHRYNVSATGIEGLELRTDHPEIVVAPGAVVELPVSLLAERDYLKTRSIPVRFRLQAQDEKKLAAEEEARFLGPGD